MNVPIILLGNKSDLHRSVVGNQIQTNHVQYYVEISLKTGKGFDELVHAIGRHVDEFCYINLVKKRHSKYLNYYIFKSYHWIHQLYFFFLMSPVTIVAHQCPLHSICLF